MLSCIETLEFQFLATIKRRGRWTSEICRILEGSLFKELVISISSGKPYVMTERLFNLKIVLYKNSSIDPKFFT